MSGLPEGIANGPSRSEHLENDAQIWERPWSLEEIRQSSANWSLAADSGVSRKLVEGIVKCVLLWCNERNSATVAVFISVFFFFTALPVPPRLLPENVVEDA